MESLTQTTQFISLKDRDKRDNKRRRNNCVKRNSR